MSPTGVSTIWTRDAAGRRNLRIAMIAPSAPYDEVADWYEHDFLVTQRAVGADGSVDRLGIDRSLAELLGSGTGTCLEDRCGTGLYADRVRQLGRTPIGVDVSTGMLHYATGRPPIALSDATTLAVATASVPAVIAGMMSVIPLSRKSLIFSGDDTRAIATVGRYRSSRDGGRR